MEVHHHSSGHHNSKSWKGYFLEFLMLFLAVTLGFIAENIREHKVEKERERQYIFSMIDDLAEDSVTLASTITELGPNIQRLDTLMHLLCRQDVKNFGGDLYYLGRLASRGNVLALHDRTIQQMKNSGGFRLINNEKVSNAILEYYNRLRFIELLMSIELNETNEYRKMAITIFHPEIFDGIVMKDNSIARPSGNPTLLTSDATTLLHLAGMVSYIKNTRIAVAKAEDQMKESAKNLIDLLKKEYHIE